MEQVCPDYNAVILKRNVGRPLAASEAQQADVLRRHKRGESLRAIAEDTSLGFQTVRSIIGKQDGTDRTTRKHLERVASENTVAGKARKWTRDALPRRLIAAGGLRPLIQPLCQFNFKFVSVLR